jgi:hypothetical protein
MSLRFILILSSHLCLGLQVLSSLQVSLPPCFTHLISHIAATCFAPLILHDRKVKVKLSLCFTKHHVMKTYPLPTVTYWGNGGIAPYILNFGTRWKWVVSFTHRPLYSRDKNPPYPWDRRLGEPQRRFGPGGNEKNSHRCLCRELKTGRPNRSLVTILTELPWLHSRWLYWML